MNYLTTLVESRSFLIIRTIRAMVNSNFGPGRAQDTKLDGGFHPDEIPRKKVESRSFLIMWAIRPWLLLSTQYVWNKAQQLNFE